MPCYLGMLICKILWEGKWQTSYWYWSQWLCPSSEFRITRTHNRCKLCSLEDPAGLCQRCFNSVFVPCTSPMRNIADASVKLIMLRKKHLNVAWVSIFGRLDQLIVWLIGCVRWNISGTQLMLTCFEHHRPLDGAVWLLKPSCDWSCCISHLTDRYLQMETSTFVVDCWCFL